jgi:UDP-2,3-diacylglucosamine pyrophosphatase LpxH
VLRVTKIPRTHPELERWSERLGRLGQGRTSEQLRRAITRPERRYGLQTDDYKTVWKLLVTADGHPGFHDALATWVCAGGRILFVTGNHDVELYWPLVRDAIRLELSDRGAPAEQAAQRVGFADGRVTIGNVHIEHGHQYEGMTRVDGDATLAPEHTQINLPLGSFVNRYFINGVEALDPFIDNVKPVQQSLLRLARQRPLKIFTTYFSGWRFLRRALQKRRLNASVLIIALALALPFLAPLVLLAIPGVRDAVLGWLPFGDVVRTVVALVSGVALSGVLPYVVGAIGEVVRRRPGKDHQLKAAESIVGDGAGPGRRRAFVCMGHTHVTAVKRIAGDPERLYINTGTWIALWPRERPDLLGRTLYTYALFESDDDDGYRATVLEWDPHADRPQPATILVPAAA